MKKIIVLCSLFLFIALAMYPQKQIRFVWGSTDLRYSKENVPEALQQNAFSFPAWKGERVYAQAVLWTKEDLSDIRIAVSELKSNRSSISADAVRAQFVRYVMADGLDKTKENQCGPRTNKAEWDSLLVADALDIAEYMDVKACSAQPVWITVSVPSDAIAGKYKGKLTVSGKNFQSISLSIELEVINRVLPSPKDWHFHLDLWQNPYSVARYHQVPLWSDMHFEAMRPVMEILADAGQKAVTATIMDRPWNGQTEDAFGPMVTKIKRADGSWLYDYTVFDKWVEFMQELGIDRQINCYSLIPWALEFDYFDQASNRIVSVKAEPGSDAYRMYWGNFIADFAKHLKEKGWFEKTTIAMDERPLEQMLNALKLIRDIEPAFKISLAGHYHPEIENEIHDLCISFGNEFPVEVKARRESSGKISTVYTCCTESRPNTFTFSPPAEAAWIGWHVMAKNYDGYLRWAYNSWTVDPLRDARFRTWPAGDCYLVYPGGRSSIRMVKLIEGIQDYEKIRIVKDELERNGKTDRLRRLQLALNRFKIEELVDKGAEKVVKQARRELNSIANSGSN